MCQRLIWNLTLVLLVSYFTILFLPVCDGSPWYKVIGDLYTTSDKYPYVVLVYKYLPYNSTSTICTGTTLSDRWVLTAAECLNPLKHVNVHITAVILDSILPIKPSPISFAKNSFKAEDWFQHPDYHPSNGFKNSTTTRSQEDWRGSSSNYFLPIVLMVNRMSRSQVVLGISPSPNYMVKSEAFTLFLRVANYNSWISKIMNTNWAYEMIYDNIKCFPHIYNNNYYRQWIIHMSYLLAKNVLLRIAVY